VSDIISLVIFTLVLLIITQLFSAVILHRKQVPSSDMKMIVYS